MPSSMRIAFGILCLLAVIALATGTFLEIGRKRRGESIIGVNQFRLRMLSGVVWMVMLGSLAYATVFSWPAAGDKVAAQRFLSLVSGSLLLLIIGLILLAYDLWLVQRGRRVQERLFQQHLDTLAQHEIERALQAKAVEKSSDEAAPPAA